MEALGISALLAMAGAYFLVRNIMYFRYPERLQSYISTSPKSKFWVAKFGEKKTTKVAKRYLLPLGALMAIVMLSIGFRNLYLILPAYF